MSDLICRKRTAPEHQASSYLILFPNSHFRPRGPPCGVFIYTIPGSDESTITHCLPLNLYQTALTDELTAIDDKAHKDAVSIQSDLQVLSDKLTDHLNELELPIEAFQSLTYYKLGLSIGTVVIALLTLIVGLRRYRCFRRHNFAPSSHLADTTLPSLPSTNKYAPRIIHARRLITRS